MKNNKLSFFYITTSVLLFATLFAGGIYGIYVSVGLNFMRSNMSNISGGVVGDVSNVSYGGAINFSPSMTGVIVLSIVLVVLSLFDFVALIKQIVFFRQFKVVKDSCLEKKIASKVKSKSSVLIFVCIIPDILFTKYSIHLSIGGTSLLIIVSTVIDLITQFQSHVFSEKYNNVNKRRRVRIR